VAATLGLAGVLLWAVHRRGEAEELPVAKQRRRAEKKNENAKAGVEKREERQVLSARLADELSEARYQGPDLSRAYKSLRRHWRKMLDPYANLPPDKVFCRLKVAFRIPYVRDYLRGRERKGRERLGAGERRWSHTRGVYESRVALFAPFGRRKPRWKKNGRAVSGTRPAGRDGGGGGGTSQSRPWASLPKGGRYTFELHLPEEPVLELGVGVLPRERHGTPASYFVVEVEADGGREIVWTQKVEPKQQLSWIEDRIVLHRWAGRRIRLHLRTYGIDGAGLWMDPKVWGRGDDAGDNLLIVLVDTLRPDGVRALGGQHARTPNMDELVRRGTSLTRFFSNGSFTRNSLISLFSANYPSSVGLVADRFAFRAGSKQKFYTMRPPQLPNHLEKQGFSVFAAVNNFFAFPYVAVGVDQGFSSLTDVRHPSLDSAAITRAAIRFMRRNRKRRFFLFVHYETLHNYDDRTMELARSFPVPEGTSMSPHWRAYLELARQMDEEVGRLMAGVRELGLDERTLVILTSDHGEVFDPAHDHFVPHYGMRMIHQHARSIWDEVIHIPMVWVRPGRIPAGKEVSAQLRGIDLAPSILEYLGLPPMSPVVGKSFWPMMEREGGRPGGIKEGDVGEEGEEGGGGEDRPVYSEGFHIRALRAFGHKYIRRDFATKRYVFRGVPRHRPEELFDLRADPLETVDVADDKPELLRRMRRMLDEIQAASDYEGLIKKHGRASSPSTPPALHLRVCAGDRETRLTGRVRVECRRSRVLVVGATGDVRLQPIGQENGGLSVELTAHNGCAGFDWTAQPACGNRLELEKDGKPLEPRLIRAGRFGLSLLDSNVLGLAAAPLLASPGPPAGFVSRRAGVYLWQDAWSSTTWVDPEAGRRAKASEDMVKLNLQQGGYVKQPSTR
jgi:arylsulfatase A-like enzyme